MTMAVMPHPKASGEGYIRAEEKAPGQPLPGPHSQLPHPSSIAPPSHCDSSFAPFKEPGLGGRAEAGLGLGLGLGSRLRVAVWGAGRQGND